MLVLEDEWGKASSYWEIKIKDFYKYPISTSHKVLYKKFMHPNIYFKYTL